MRRLVATALVAASVLPSPVEAAPPDVALVVVVVVDQLGRTYFDRYRAHLTHGFGRLIKGGALYPRGVFAYANTETAPGHSTIGTGTWPSVHGITANHWFDASGAERYCFSDSAGGRGPMNLLAPTIADALIFATRRKSRVVSVSLKDRAAIALGGHAPTFVSWYDSSSGRFISGQWPGVPPTPEWFNAVSLEHLASDAFGSEWKRLEPKLDYRTIVGADDLPHEELVLGLGRTFPRTLGKGTDGPTSLAWRKKFYATPSALEGMVDIALEAFDKEHLGEGPATDMLALGISSLDLAGHNWGSDSQEAFDVLLRIDRQIGRVMDHVNERLGEGRVLWVLTADHGVTPTVESVASLGLPTGRVDPDEIKQVVDGTLALRKKQMRLVEIDAPRLFLSAFDDAAERVAASRDVAVALRKLPYIAEAYAAADLADWPEPFGERFRRSHFEGRDGDVLYRALPHWYPADHDAEGNVQATGTGHGSPYTYDSDVPIVFNGPGVRPGEDKRPYAMTRVAPSIAAVLGIQPPAAALDAPLPAVTQ